MNGFEKELRGMFAGSSILYDPKFCGKTMIARLDDQKLAKISFSTTGHADHYTGLHVSIINKNTGPVDSQMFKFVDIIGKKSEISGSKSDPHMWDDGREPRWYTPVSIADKALISDTVQDYVEMFQDQSEALSMQFR